MITIVDYGMGNLCSVQKSLEKIGASTRITSDPKEIAQAQALVLPGVGAFGAVIKNLKKYRLIDVLKQKITEKTPFLGICLGLQVLFEKSEESPEVPGLGIFKGTVRHFYSSGSFPRKKLTIPHMGWNQVSLKKVSAFFQAVPENTYFYFVHSFYVAPEDKKLVLGTTKHGISFISAIEHENIIATQFHPEKSGDWGLTLLKNFVKIANDKCQMSK
jgi:glutamine amidotransferase